MKEQRVNDPEQVTLMKQRAIELKNNPMLDTKKNKKEIPKWKLQSMQFRAICHPEKNQMKNKNMMKTIQNQN